MKRVAAILMLAVLLTGCGADSPPSTTIQTEPPEMVGTFPGLGGVMPEMTVSTADGQTVTLSALLAEKKLVVLNFWFENCGWCMREFPMMELAYQRYRDDVQIVALNPADGADRVKAFYERNALSFPMAACPRAWATEAGVSAYPTSIFIDRNGVVCLIHVGAITTAEAWYQVFAAFTGDDYRQKIYGSIDELLQ